MAELNEQPKAPLSPPTTLKALIEALVFAAHEPLTVQQIKAIYQGESRGDESRQLEIETVRQTIADLNKEYAKHDRPYRIIPIAGGYQFSTVTEYADWIGLLYKEQGRRKLSQSGVETLAIIAYKQPITKSEVESIRGVNCDYVLKTLLEKELVTVTGRAETVGRPLLYGTTREFLKYFGLNEVTDLPRPREIEEILGESQFETERRMLEAQQGADQVKKDQEDFKSRLPHIPKRKSELESKGVEIVQRKKTREIKMVSDEERMAREAAGQEAIAFDSPSPVSRNEGGEVPSDTMPVVKEIPALNDPAVIETEQPVPAEVSIPEAENHAMEAEESDAGVPAEEEMLDSAGEPMDGGKGKTRWQSWKEKVTGFIRKIFG